MHRPLDPRDEPRGGGPAEPVADHDPRGAGGERRHRMDIEQDRDPEPRARGVQQSRGFGMIGAVIAFDPMADLVARKAAPPQIGAARAARHQPQAAAQLDRLRAVRNGRCAFIDPCVALMLGAVEVDPGARARRDDQRFAALRRQRERIDVPVLQRQQRGQRHAQRRAQRQRIVAPGMRHRQHHRRYRIGRTVADKGRRNRAHAPHPMPMRRIGQRRRWATAVATCVRVWKILNPSRIQGVLHERGGG